MRGSCLTQGQCQDKINSDVQPPNADGTSLSGASGAPAIPNKLYFRIGDVARLAGVKPHVLRYWETEFAAIAPKKSGTGHRLYRRKDVELILEIRRLLYEKRYTIEGARKAIAQRAMAQPGSEPTSVQVVESATRHAPDLQFIRDELTSILHLLNAK
jgi:DNA-binding transcriptional MerR regulator